MHTVFYVYADKTTTGAQAQVNAFQRAGFTGPGGDSLQKSHCIVDLDGKRDNREILLENASISRGSVIRVACAAYIGKKGRDRARVLRILAENDISVAILDGDPVVYDTPLKRAAFLEEAEAVARADNGRAQGRKNKGRPPAVRLTLEQWRAILKLWRQYDDQREAFTSRHIVRSMIADYSTENGLKIEADNVKNDFLHGWFGRRSDTSDREPPKQLWIKEN